MDVHAVPADYRHDDEHNCTWTHDYSGVHLCCEAARGQGGRCQEHQVFGPIVVPLAQDQKVG